MPPRRLTPLAGDAIHLDVDGVRIPARAGEPIAVSLLASGRLVLGRSVKYHRPRGAACFVGRCDGCLMRVDGLQSVMTCRAPARDATVVETQNVVGSAQIDLLSATDWFFPAGMNHHEMFTWNADVNRVMQKVARRIAGIGKIPDQVQAPVPAREIHTDVLVVGGGPAGLRAAAVCARSKLRVLLVEEESALGGSLRFWPPRASEKSDVCAREALATHVGCVRDAGVDLITAASAVAVYDPREDIAGATATQPSARTSRESLTVVVDGEDGLVRVHANRIVFATGRHYGASGFAGADRPGVIDARAACVLLAHGVLPGGRVVLAGDDCAELAAALVEAGAEVIGPFPEVALREASGRTEVEGCHVEIDGRTTLHECDAIVVASPTSAAYELAAQAGVGVRFDGSGFEVDARASDGATAVDDVRVVGSAAGVHDLEVALAQAERAARAVVAELEARLFGRRTPHG